MQHDIGLLDPLASHNAPFSPCPQSMSDLLWTWLCSTVSGPQEPCTGWREAFLIMLSASRAVWAESSPQAGSGHLWTPFLSSPYLRCSGQSPQRPQEHDSLIFPGIGGGREKNWWGLQGLHSRGRLWGGATSSSSGGCREGLAAPTTAHAPRRAWGRVPSYLHGAGQAASISWGWGYARFFPVEAEPCWTWGR